MAKKTRRNADGDGETNWNGEERRRARGMMEEEQAAQDHGEGGEARENEKTITSEDEGLNEKQ